MMRDCLSAIQLVIGQNARAVVFPCRISSVDPIFFVSLHFAASSKLDFILNGTRKKKRPDGNLKSFRLMFG
jgi:hypothetical protein